MNNSLAKYKDLALKVVYYTKKRQLGNKIFFATSKFQEVLAYFEKNLKDSQTFLKSCYFLNGKQIYPSDILLYFCTVDPNLRLVEEDMFLEIEELEHLDDASEPIYEKLLKPLINPFKLIILNIKDGVLQMVDFPTEKIKELGLDTINNNFACCNSTDALYISCGTNFWIISHNNFQIEKKEMPFSKEKHSMAYILSNNTIFIAGGTDDSFYYDINSKEFINWGKMNGIQEQPALIQFGDYLYSFNSFSQEGIYFERTKLTNPAKKWEKLIPQSGDQESGFFYNKFYGVSKCSGGNILFAGGINNQLRTFIYNLKLNVLYINSSKDESILLNERSFYKIDHNFNIAIPADIEKDHIIAIVNKNSKTLNLVPFEQIGVKTRNNLLRYDNPRDRIPGHIIIQCRYMALKDYENFLKQKEMQQNSKTKGGFDIYNRKEQGKKLGDKLNPDPYKYQYRGKTPALERISEGKSDEEDEDDIGKNKSSSAKKEKRTLDLGLKLENIGKFNFSTQKKEEIKKTENKNKLNNDDISIKNQDQKENKENINSNNNDVIKDNSVINNNGSINNDIVIKNNIVINNNKLNENQNIVNSNEVNLDANKEEVIVKKEENSLSSSEQPPKLKEENKKETVVVEEKKGEIEEKVIKPEIEKLRGLNNKRKVNKEIKHKKLNLNLNKNEEGKNNELNSDYCYTPNSNLTDKNSNSKNINASAQSNDNMNLNQKLEINAEKVTNINVVINQNDNSNNVFQKKEENKKIIQNVNISNKLDNKEKENLNNYNKNSKGTIHKVNYVQNKNMSSSPTNNNNSNQNINNINNQQNRNINDIEGQKKINNISYISNNAQNLKTNYFSQKDNNIIHKSNTAFLTGQKNYYQTFNNNNIHSSNPFIDNSKYQNIGEKESYNLKEESEPNANKILTSKNGKTLKEIKKSQKKTGYKTNTVTSIPINAQGIIAQSNQNIIINQNIINIKDKNSNSSNNKIVSSYKASTHKQSKGKKIITLSHSNNKSPEQKNRIPIQKNNNNIQTEQNKKGEMYLKINKTKSFANQRLNNSNNISSSNSGNNSIRIMKGGVAINNQQNLSNERIIRGDMRGNNVIITKDGKRYVLAKNVQRIRKEEDDFRKLEERRKNYTQTEGNKTSELLNNQ